VSRVGAGSGVAGENGSGEMGVVEFAGEASVAVGLKSSVPISAGADFDEDVAIGRRICADGNTAKAGRDL